LRRFLFQLAFLACGLPCQGMVSGIYRRRHPEQSDLYRIAFHHFEAYEKTYPERYEAEYGYLRKIVPATVARYLDCGIMENGFARVRCPACGHDFFVAFSCKTRFFCPSCAEKRTLIWSAWVKAHVLKNVAHRQWVFTIPKALRKLFTRDRQLLGELAQCASETILELYQAVFPDPQFRPGIITSTQTFGDLLVWHPHIHCLVSDGVFDGDGAFHPGPKADPETAALIFREKVFAMLQGRERISDGLVEKMRQWHHSGFSVHDEVVIRREDREALGRLAQYVVHASFAAGKIRYVEQTGCVMYKSKMHLGKKRNFEVLDAIEFLHRVCLHIPDPYEAVIRYYGHYANAARGKRKKLGLEEAAAPVVVDDAPDGRTCRRSWARLIYQVYEVDPLKCPKCGEQMRMIAFILEREEVICILRHLKMWPIEYPKPCPIDARASPLSLELLQKQLESRHIN